MTHYYQHNANYWTQLRGYNIRFSLNRSWLIGGSLLWLCIPSLRGHSAVLGWTPYWLLVAPLLNLMVQRLFSKYRFR